MKFTIRDRSGILASSLKKAAGIASAKAAARVAEAAATAIRGDAPTKADTEEAAAIGVVQVDGVPVVVSSHPSAKDREFGDGEKPAQPAFRDAVPHGIDEFMRTMASETKRAS